MSKRQRKSGPAATAASPPIASEKKAKKRPNRENGQVGDILQTATYKRERIPPEKREEHDYQEFTEWVRIGTRFSRVKKRTVDERGCWISCLVERVTSRGDDWKVERIDYRTCDEQWYFGGFYLYSFADCWTEKEVLERWWPKDEQQNPELTCTRFAAFIAPVRFPWPLVDLVFHYLASTFVDVVSSPSSVMVDTRVKRKKAKG